jgi:hypothetical protein
MRSCCYKIFAGITLFALLTLPVSARPLGEERHNTQARDYLALLDDGQYESTWDAMSPFFKLLHDQYLWQGKQQAIRDAYGPLKSRLIRLSSQRQTYKNSPDGNYVVVQFDTVFRNKAKAVETVVLDCQNTFECTIRDYIIN